MTSPRDLLLSMMVSLLVQWLGIGLVWVGVYNSEGLFDKIVVVVSVVH